MDFNLIVTRRIEDRNLYHEKQETHYTPDTLLSKIKGEIGQWNVDREEGEELTFTIQKVPNNTETLGISVEDEFKISEQIG